MKTLSSDHDRTQSTARTFMVLMIVTVVYLFLMGAVFIFTLVEGHQKRGYLEDISEQQALAREVVFALLPDGRAANEVLGGLATHRTAFAIGLARLQPIPAIRRAPVERRWESLDAQIDAVVRERRDAADRQAALAEIGRSAAALTVALDTLEESFRTEQERLILIGQIGGIGTVVVWLILGYLYLRNTRARIDTAQEQNRFDTQVRIERTQEHNSLNQDAAMRLLDELTALADGDLTVHATVTEDMTGAIADSVNYAVEALRGLVETINRTASQVADAVERTQVTATGLADASNRQAQEIASASAAVEEMAHTIVNVSKGASASGEVASRSVDIASRGGQAARRTIQGMGVISEQIQETSKRIKRLGESSQEIGEIVALIGDIADQTGILALNAAIQASAAGEAGRGFATVADEVQRLAERSTSAAQQIESLVNSIQADTAEAIDSMERSTTQVVEGTRLAKDAGEALAETNAVANELAEHIREISEGGRRLADVAQGIARTMETIRSIAGQTAAGAREADQSIGQLNSLAAELRISVAGFRLPAGGAGR